MMWAPGSVAVGLLVHPGGELGDVSVHGAVGKVELEVDAAGAPSLPLAQLEMVGVSKKVGLPPRASFADLVHLALALEVPGLAHAVLEFVRVIPDELLVVEHVHH